MELTNRVDSLSKKIRKRGVVCYYSSYKIINTMNNQLTDTVYIDICI